MSKFDLNTDLELVHKSFTLLQIQVSLLLVIAKETLDIRRQEVMTIGYVRYYGKHFF